MRPLVALYMTAGDLVRLPAGLRYQLDRSGPPESPWLTAGLGALLLVSVALVIWRRRRRPGWPTHRWLRRSGLRRSGLAAWLVGLGALTGLAGLNACVGYIPDLPALFGALPGQDGPAGGSHVLKLEVGAPDFRLAGTQPGRHHGGP